MDGYGDAKHHSATLGHGVAYTTAFYVATLGLDIVVNRVHEHSFSHSLVCWESLASLSPAAKRSNLTESLYDSRSDRHHRCVPTNAYP